MPSHADDYLDYCLELLAPCGHVTFRPMFGGYGLYNNGLFFAIIADETLFFKVDDTTRPTYEEYEMEPFTYEKQGKKFALGYYEVPVDVLENPEQLQEFVDTACAVALRAKK